MEKCDYCQYEWMRRTLEKPKRCPRCRRYNWDGRKKKNSYDVSKLKVGEEVKFYWHTQENGMPDLKQNKNMNKAIDNYARRNGKRFYKIPTSFGLVVRRVE